MFTLKKYISVDNTLLNIFNLIKSHYGDPLLKTFDKWNLLKVFNYVSKGLHYIPDPKNVPIYGGDDIELLKSPVQTINTNGGDCDDKAILIGALMQRRGIPYRFAVVITEPGRDWHHIYPEIFVSNQWKPFDATYSYNLPYTETPFIRKRIFEIRDGRLIAYTTIPKTSSNESVNYRKPQCRQAILNGARASLGLNGTRLALLEGVPLNPIQRRKNLLNGYRRELLGSLGIDPATIVAAGITLYKFFFGGGGEPIPPNVNTAMQNIMKDIASVQSQYGGANNADKNPEAMQKIVLLYAVKGALLDKYGLIPPGKAIHDVWPDVPWSSVQGEIESSATGFFPYLYWVWANPTGGGSNAVAPDPIGSWKPSPGKLEWWHDDITRDLFRDYKNQSGTRWKLFQQQTQTQSQSENKKTNSAGSGTKTVLILGAVGLGAYMMFSK